MQLNHLNCKPQNNNAFLFTIRLLKEDKNWKRFISLLVYFNRHYHSFIYYKLNFYRFRYTISHGLPFYRHHIQLISNWSSRLIVYLFIYKTIKFEFSRIQNCLVHSETSRHKHNPILMTANNILIEKKKLEINAASKI